MSLQVIVPLPSWDLNTKEPITLDPEKYAVETELIFKYSPFSDWNQLMEQFSKIESSSGKHKCPCKDIDKYKYCAKFITSILMGNTAEECPDCILGELIK